MLKNGLANAWLDLTVETSEQRGLIMDQINNQMAMVTAQAKLTMPIAHERKPTRRWSESTEKMTLLLFTRLADLFSSKAASKGLIIYFDEAKGIYSEQFDLWCRKLDDLKLEDFKRGMDGLEKRAEEQYRLGGEMWPPSYAEFRALAFPETNRDSQAHKPVPSLYDPTTGKYRLEDMTSKERRYKEGTKQCQDILAMFAEPEPSKPLTQDEIKDAEKLRRLQNGENIAGNN